MGTYLFSWNPKKWPWPTYELDIAELNAKKEVTKNWRCISYTKIQPGDRAFIVRVGSLPRGIIGSGQVISKPFLSPHHKNITKDIYRVTVKFDILLNAETEPILTNEILKLGDLATQNWAPQASGISIKPELVDTLEAVWEDFISQRF